MKVYKLIKNLQYLVSKDKSFGDRIVYVEAEKNYNKGSIFKQIIMAKIKDLIEHDNDKKKSLHLVGYINQERYKPLLNPHELECEDNKCKQTS